MERADGAAIALRPVDQPEWVTRCLARPRLQRLVLEKPLAASPEAAARTLDALLQSRRVFRVAHTFGYTPWGQALLESVDGRGQRGSLSLEWSFLAHHFRHGLRNWKRSQAAGGGAIRFYGIHAIALMAEIGYRDAARSRAFGESSDELDRWEATLMGAGLPSCEIAIDSKAAVQKFLLSWAPVGAPRETLVDLEDPFQAEGASAVIEGTDRRAPVLARLCRSMWEDEADATARLYGAYAATIGLWRTVEQRTEFCGAWSETVR